MSKGAHVPFPSINTHVDVLATLPSDHAHKTANVKAAAIHLVQGPLQAGKLARKESEYLMTVSRHH